MFAKFSVKRPFTVAVGVIVVLVLGVISFMNMTTDLLPKMNLPYVVVYTTYVGASPEAVETTVTKPLEAAMATVGELKNISSVSSENVSTITMEFNDNANMDSAMIELNAVIDRVKPNWPSGVGTPTMIKINPDMMAVVVAAVAYEGKDIVELSDYVDNTLLGALEGIDGVASVSASGLIEEEITVSIEQEKIDEINSIILKEVDKELYKVEQELKDGEQKLLDAKRMLEKQGKAGIRQLDDAIGKLDQSSLEPMIGELETQKTTLGKQLSDAQAAVTQLEAALAGLSQASMGESEKAALKQMRATLEALNAELSGHESALGEVEKQLAALDPATPAPDQSPSPTPQPTPTPKPRKEKQQRIKEIEKIDIAAARGPVFSLLPAAHAAGDGGRTELLAEKSRLEGEIESVKAQIKGLENSSVYQGLLTLEKASAQKETLEGQLAQAKGAIEQLPAAIAQIEQMTQKLKNGIIPGGVMEGIDQDTNVEDARAMLEKTRSDVKGQLSDASDMIEKNQKKLGEARKEFEEKREEAFKEAKLDGVITVQMISQIISAQNFSMPAGYLTEDGQDYLVRVGDEYTDVDDLAATVLFTMDLDTLKEVRLRDVADVGITNNADTVYAKVNKNDGVLLSFQKQSTYSTADVAHSVIDTFDRLQAATPGLHLTPLLNQGIYIDMIIESVLSNLMSGAALAILILLLFLFDFRPTLIIALSIPISVVAAFVTMYFTGITLNVMSLAGLALGVGMLVDNSIVVIENIYRLRGDGMPILEACVKGTQQMSGAIFSSTLTTVCVFLPLVFITGIAKQMFTDMGLTITYSLMASLLVALTLVPAMSSFVLKRQKKEKKHSIFDAIQNGYAKILSATLKFKLPVLVLALALLVYSGMQAVSMGTAFIPEVDSQQMTVTLSLPTDTTFEENTDLANRVLDELLTVSDIDSVGVFSGGSAGLMTGGGGSGSGGSMTYYITLKADKAHRNTEIAREIEQKTEPIGCDLSIRTSNMDITMLYGSGISVRVLGPDLEILRAYATDIAEKMRAIPGVIDVSDGQEDTVPEITLSVDKEEAIKNNLTVAQIYQFVAQLVSDGVEVSTMTAGGKEYAVMAVDGKNLALTREELSNRTIEVKKADETIQVRLGDVCQITEGSSLSSIRRDQQRHLVTASCGVDAGYNIGLVGREVEAIIEGYPVEPGYTVEISGESDTIASTLNDLILMVALAIVLIYLIMVAQFQSFLMPFIVIFTVPLAFTGGLLALILAGMEISMVGMLGFLILSGVIVNNGIVFVDSVNQMRIEGMDKRSALIETGRLRLRPILMTALTTILGMSTMAMAQGMGAEMMQPLALVTIGGLSYGTLLTLFVVPALYDMMTGKKMKVRKLEHADGERAQEGDGSGGDELPGPAQAEDLDAEFDAFVNRYNERDDA